MERSDDFKARRKHLENLTEEELEKRFWQLTEQLMDPVMDLAVTHTTPSIERSVLLRMGFSSLEADSLVKQVLEHGLISKGAGHVVYKVARELNLPVREAGRILGSGQKWDTAGKLFPEGGE